MGRFRFQDLKIWQLAIEIANELFDVADDMEQKKYFDLLTSSGELECPCPITLRRAQDLAQKRILNNF